MRSRGTAPLLLANERARTEAGIASLEHELRSVVESADTTNIDDEHDPEGATIAFERARIQALIDHGRRHLDEVDAAGARVGGGGDARCRVCGVIVPAERLAAVPGTDAASTAPSGGDEQP